MGGGGRERLGRGAGGGGGGIGLGLLRDSQRLGVRKYSRVAGCYLARRPDIAANVL